MGRFAPYPRALAAVWDNAPAGLSGADGEQEGWGG